MIAVFILILFAFILINSIIFISIGLQNNEDNTTIQGFVVLIISIVGIYLNIKLIGEPQPLDVYRGKTTLEITYRDSVPVDSVVVYK